MRIEGYALPATPAAVPHPRSSTPAAGQSESRPPLAEGEPVTAHDKLRRLLDEKRGWAQAAFEAPEGGELGKHIDLRA